MVWVCLGLARPYNTHAEEKRAAGVGASARVASGLSHQYGGVTANRYKSCVTRATRRGEWRSLAPL